MVHPITFQLFQYPIQAARVGISQDRHTKHMYTALTNLLTVFEAWLKSRLWPRPLSPLQTQVQLFEISFLSSLCILFPWPNSPPRRRHPAGRGGGLNQWRMQHYIMYRGNLESFFFFTPESLQKGSDRKKNPGFCCVALVPPSPSPPPPRPLCVLGTWRSNHIVFASLLSQAPSD